ncbi:TMEM175 family protein [Streptomyces flaveolus]|uniref:TMEM175 family protein n=1 Tax=Streptomyces flaveolus TaxID=67297 RepID=UPI0036FA6F8A
MPESQRLPPSDAARAAARFRRSDTARLEAFSDGVFAIAATVLVLEIHDPAHDKGGPARALLEQWPSCVGYLASFACVAVIWLNHRQAFARSGRWIADCRGANLLLLFTTAAPAFPADPLRWAVFVDHLPLWAGQSDGSRP